LIFKLKEFITANEKLEIVQPACLPAVLPDGRQIGRQAGTKRGYEL
jgi:hypothetical protein